MPFIKGQPKKGGRQKGTPNRSKVFVKEIVEAALGKSIPDRLLEIAKAQPREEKEILLALLPYAYPKLQSTEIEATIHGDVEVTVYVEQALKEIEAMGER